MTVVKKFAKKQPKPEEQKSSLKTRQNGSRNFTKTKLRMAGLATLRGPNGKRHLIYQGMATGAAAVASLVTAMTQSFTSPALPSMRADPTFIISENQESWVSAVVPAAALVGSLAAGPLVNRLGRRTTFIISSLPFSIGWAIIATAADVRGVAFGRLICGLCVGLITTCRLVFMPEMIQHENRKKFFPVPALALHFGILICYTAWNHLSWRGIAWLGAILSLPLVPMLFPLPDTPYYLASIGRREESLAALKLLRSSSREAEVAQQDIDNALKRAIEGNKRSVWEIAVPPNRWPVCTGLFLLVAQQTTGHTAVLSYASTILSTGTDNGNPNTGTEVLGIVSVIGTFASIYAIQNYRRRTLIRLSTWVIVLSLLTLSAFFWAQQAGGTLAVITKDIGFVPKTALVVFILGYNFGWGPVPWIFLVEGIPSWIRGKANAFVVSANYGTSFLVSKTFIWSASVLGSHNTFMIYAVTTAISAAIIHQFMPETYRMRIHEVDQIYQGRSKKKDE